MRQRRGFTLVEIMTVVFIIGTLMTIAAPNFIRARDVTRGRACSENLQKIQWAKEQWAMESNKISTDTPTEAELAGSFKYLVALPQCPASGAYTLNNLGTSPDCTIGGTHVVN